MKLWKKILVGVLGALALGVLGLVAAIELLWDRHYDVAGPDLHASTDPELIKRGKYLVHGPAHCSNCHVGSFDEMARADAGEPLPLAGGAKLEMGPLGAVYTRNLTPDRETGLGQYDDRVVFRMMRHAIKPDGTATLREMMPFYMMADDDLVAIVSYLRTLEPVRRAVPDAYYTFMGKAIRVTSSEFQPKLGQTVPAHAPPEAPTRERGEYVARYVANCRGCHTKADESTMTWTGPEFAGGLEFDTAPEWPGGDPKQWFRSPNLTPIPNGVLKTLGTKENWIARFRAGRAYKASPMQWGPFSRMSDADLEALWIFFNSLPPVPNDLGPTTFYKEEEKK